LECKINQLKRMRICCGENLEERSLVIDHWESLKDRIDGCRIVSVDI